MAKNPKMHKPMTSRGKGMIALVIMLVITVGLSYLSIAGMSLDAEGVQKLRAWLPVSSSNFPKSLTLGLDVGSGEKMDYALASATPVPTATPEATQAPEATETPAATEVPEAAAVTDGASPAATDAPTETPTEAPTEVPTATPEPTPVVYSDEFKANVDKSVEIMKKRLDAFGLEGCQVTRTGDNTISVKYPSYDNVDILKSLVASAGKIEFQDENGSVLLTNADIASTRIIYSTYYYIEITMTKDGRAALQSATENNLDKTLAIYLDGTKLVAPSVDEVNTSGKMTISFGYTKDATTAIAAMMENEPLPLLIVSAESSVVEPAMGAMLTVVLIILAAVFAAAAVYMVIRNHAAGLAGVWALWAYVVCFFFLMATVTLVLLPLYTFIAVLMGLLLAIYVCAVQLKGMDEAIQGGRDARSAVRTGFHTSLKNAWLAHGAVLALSLILMIFPFSRSFGYILATAVVSSAFTCMGLIRWFVPCLVCVFGSKKSAVSSKSANQ